MNNIKLKITFMRTPISFEPSTNKLDSLIGAIKFIMKIALDTSLPDNMQAKEEIYFLLGLNEKAYVVVTWPEVQDFMDEDWFEDEAILEVDGKFGSSAYFIPIRRLIE